MDSDVQKQLSELFVRRQSGVKLDLNEMKRLCAALGNPERDLKFIHIAGTNGKGSVAAMCSAILKAHGISVGLYTSPHLIRYHERFRFNEEEITDDALEKWLSQIFKVAGEATFFEISTALALCWFREQGAQMVVWETGLGGRLDATNVVTPQVSVITRIGMDHIQLLGNSLIQIAGEKAGIIKPGIPIVIISQEAEVLSVIQDKARELKSPLTMIAEKDLGKFTAPLVGDHQRWNTALAVEACKKAVPDLKDEIIERGLSKTIWPGRCQLLERGNGKPPVLLDGAHNTLGLKVLMEEIQNRWRDQKITLIFGVLGDKDISEMVKILKPVVAEVLLVPVRSERTADLKKVQKNFPKSRICKNLSEALSDADQKSFPTVITGSLFLAGEALSILKGADSVFHPNEMMNLK